MEVTEHIIVEAPHGKLYVPISATVLSAQVKGNAQGIGGGEKGWCRIGKSDEVVSTPFLHVSIFIFYLLKSSFAGL
jgi:hypothetical protein